MALPQPDLNPIEHLWDELEGKFELVLFSPSCSADEFAELEAPLQQEWQGIPQQVINAHD